MKEKRPPPFTIWGVLGMLVAYFMVALILWAYSVLSASAQEEDSSVSCVIYSDTMECEREPESVKEAAEYYGTDEVANEGIDDNEATEDYVEWLEDQ